MYERNEMAHHDEALLSESELVLPSTVSWLAPVIVDDLIRVGAINDGGYVIPKHLVHDVDVLVSMGIEEDWSFDREFSERNPRIRIHAYDHTISRNSFRRGVLLAAAGMCAGRRPPSEVLRRMKLLRSYGSFFSGANTHYQQRVYNRVDLSSDVTLAQIFARCQSEAVFLKIDIEGSEYRIVNGLIEYADRIAGMVIEFHDTEPFRSIFSAAIVALLEKFEIVHVHANNFMGVASDGVPEALEVTFEKKGKGSSRDRRMKLPLPFIDAPNDPDRADYKIRFSI